MSLFGASATPCQTPAMAVERSAQARLALQSLKAAAEEDNDDAGDEMLESAQQQLLAAGHAWAADGDEGLDAVDDALGGGADGDGGALDALLAQLRAEPADDAGTSATARRCSSARCAASTRARTSSLTRTRGFGSCSAWRRRCRRTRRRSRA